MDDFILNGDEFVIPLYLCELDWSHLGLNIFLNFAHGNEVTKAY